MILGRIHNSFAALSFVQEKHRFDDRAESLRALEGVEGVDAAAIRQTIGELQDDLGHIDTDTYSLGEAIAATGRLDELLDNACSGAMSELTGEKRDEASEDG
jgi:hypothetical protein